MVRTPCGRFIEWSKAVYIASVRIQNYRCFKDTTVQFQPGLNVIIGENNSGKTTLLKALSLVFDRRGSRRPTSHDFHKLLEPLDKSPKIDIAVTLRSSAADTEADRALVATWLTKLERPWEAQLTYSFFLPEQDSPAFLETLGSKTDRAAFFEAVEESLPKFVARVYAGNPETNVTADGESLAKFDCQFLDAIRDVESEMFSGGTPLFRTMLKEVLDAGTDSTKLRKTRTDFRKESKKLRDGLVNRLDTSQLFDLVTETGAVDGGTPILEGGVQESDIIAALRLYIDRSDFSFPVTHQGLGYNNLIYISLMLASMSFRSSQRRGQNAAIFPMLLIEEPEAHLHPALQYKLLSHIVNRVKNEPSDSRQVFVTTHSTHVTSAAGLEPIVCMSLKPDGSVGVAYPAKLFPDTADGRNATKSTMLFAKGVILVEGIAEQLIVPALANLLGKPFDHHHVTIVRVDGLTFKHFLPLFGAGTPDEFKDFALERRLACLVDADPSRKKKNVTNAKWKSCFPFQLNHDDSTYEYRVHSAVVDNLNSLREGQEHVGIFHGDKTLEYDLALVNHEREDLVSGSMRHAANVRSLASQNKKLSGNLKSLFEDDELRAMDSMSPKTNMEQHRYAAAYLKCAEKCKGEHAFAVEQALRKLANKSAVKCPSYIQQAIEWVTATIPDKGSTT